MQGMFVSVYYPDKGSTCANCPYANRDIFANVVAMRARLGQLQLVNSLVLSK